MTKVILTDPVQTFLEDFDRPGKLIIKNETEIPQEYLDDLKAQKDATAGQRTRDLHKFASIPLDVVLKWQREGFDVFHEPAHKIMAKLSAENLGAFITTTKKL